MFTEEFTEYASMVLPEHHNNTFLGNFNIYVSNTLDTGSAIFNDSIDAMGLYQDVGFNTHQAGNVLDLVLSDITSDTKVLTTAPGPNLTDHQAVIGTLSIKRLNPIKINRLVRPISKVSEDQWKDEFNPDNIELNCNLDILVSSFNSELRRVYDTLAPEKKCKVNLRS